MNTKWWKKAGGIGAGVSLLSFSVLAVAGSAQAASWTNGMLVEFAHNPDVYEYYDGALHWIPSAQLFNALGESWSAVVHLPANSARPPVGANVPQPNAGPSVMAPGLYRVEGSNAVYANWVPLAPAGHHVSSSLHWVPNASTFNAMGFLWSQVKTVPKLTQAVGMPAVLVRLVHHNQVYLEQDGTLHWISSPQMLHDLGYHWANIFPVNALPLPVGAPETLPSSANPYNVYTPIESQALQWSAAHTTLPVGGPESLPPVNSSGYLAAQATGDSQSYSVTLWNTTKALPLNSPSLTQYLSATPHVASFGMKILPHAMPAQGAPNYLSMLGNANSNWQPIYGKNGVRVMLPNGAGAFQYTSAQGSSLTWGEGDWTIEVSGGTPAKEMNTAGPILTYLDTHLLPPDPGIVAVRLTAQGPTTSIDWATGPDLAWVNSQNISSSNPVNTLAMAVSWHIARG